MNKITKTQKICSIILKTIVVLSAVIGTLLSYLAGRNSFMGGNHVFMYFTIQSNIAIAIISAIGLYLLLRNKPIGKVWYTIKFVGTVSITLTGVVFGLVLAPTLGANAWNLQYAIYAGIGYVNNWQFAEGINYPYFFLNWGSEAGAFGFTNQLPFMGSAWWILLLLVFLIIVGYVYLAIADLFGKKKSATFDKYSYSNT